MTGRYAERTTVSVAKTQEEIRSALKRYGAAKYAYFEDDDKIGIGFEIKNRRVRFVVPLPTKQEAMVKVNASRAQKFSENALDQKVRQRWRALLLSIKAKLESVESGIESIDEAFMAQLVLPNGQTMAELALPQIEAAYSTGTMPPLLGTGLS